MEEKMGGGLGPDHDSHPAIVKSFDLPVFAGHLCWH